MICKVGSSARVARVMTVCLITFGFFSSLIMLLPLAPNVSAATTYTWSQTSGNLASTAANWSPSGPPTNGDSVIFDATSTAACTWDLAVTLVDFTMDTGYSGTLTIGANFETGSLTQKAGILAGSAAYIVTCSGNVDLIGGTVNSNFLRITMTGDETHIYIRDKSVGLWNLTIEQETSIWIYPGIHSLSFVQYWAKAGATMIVPEVSYTAFGVRTFPGYPEWKWANYGEVIGNTTNGYLYWDVRDDATIIPGTITSDLEIILRSAATADETLTLGGSLTTEHLAIHSQHSTYTITVNTSGNDMDIGSLYVGPRGTLVLMDSAVSCEGAWIVDGGELDYGTASIVFQETDTTMFTNDGSWCWFADPRGIHYNGITYLGYVNSLGDIVIQSYNEDTHAWDRYTLHWILQVDDHNNPVIWVLPNERLIVAWTGHAYATFYYAISTYPRDITSWGDVQTFTGDTFSYPQFAQLSSEANRLYLFYRSGTSITGDWKYRTSTDNGASWSSATTLFDYGAASMYVKVDTNGVDKIYFAASRSVGSIQSHQNVTFCYYYSGSFYNASGSVITNIAGLPISQPQMNLVYDSVSSGYDAWIWDIAEEDGQIAIVYAVFLSDSDHRYYYSRWSGSSWNALEITDGGKLPYYADAQPHYSGGVYLDHEDVNKVYLSTDVGGVLEIYEGITGDSGENWDLTAITSSSDSHNFRPFVVWGHSELTLVWMSGPYHTFNIFNTRLLVDGLYPGFMSAAIELEAGESVNLTGRPYGQVRIDAESVPITVITDMYLRTTYPNGVSILCWQTSSPAITTYLFNEYATSIQWSATSVSTTVVSYTLTGLDGEQGYRVYQNGEVITTGTGPMISFVATGGGEFEIEIWHSRQVSILVVLAVNMVGLGIFVSVIVGWIMPFSRKIKDGGYRSTDQMLRDLVKGVVFIIVSLLMWGLLQNIAIG